MAAQPFSIWKSYHWEHEKCKLPPLLAAERNRQMQKHIGPEDRHYFHSPIFISLQSYGLKRTVRWDRDGEKFREAQRYLGSANHLSPTKPSSWTTRNSILPSALQILHFFQVSPTCIPGAEHFLNPYFLLSGVTECSWKSICTFRPYFHSLPSLLSVLFLQENYEANHTRLTV